MTTGHGAAAGNNAVTKYSDQSVSETVNRLLELLKQKQLRIFASIDQAAEAQAFGLQLRETWVILFGHPAAGTPVMEAQPLAGLDLPLKIMIWDDAGRTAVSYCPVDTLVQRYGLHPELSAHLRAIDAISDTIVS